MRALDLQGASRAELEQVTSRGGRRPDDITASAYIAADDSDPAAQAQSEAARGQQTAAETQERAAQAMERAAASMAQAASRSRGGDTGPGSLEGAE